MLGKSIRTIVLYTFCTLTTSYTFAERATYGEPVKYQYDAPTDVRPGVFQQTGEYVDGYSFVCDMGQALPISNREGKWYENKPIPGLRLELRARAALYSMDELKAAGFVAVVKNNEDLKLFRPLGQIKNGSWEGDVFNSWPVTRTKVKVFSELMGRDGYAEFDLLDGNGFYYEYMKKESPDYFLSNCRRILRKNLPVYDWIFDDDEELDLRK